MTWRLKRRWAHPTKSKRENKFRSEKGRARKSRLFCLRSRLITRESVA